MKEKKAQGKSGVMIYAVEMYAIKYSITGVYGSYEFQAAVAEYDSDDGIDGGCIDMLRIQKIVEFNGHRESKWVFEYDYGWNAGSEEKDDVKAYRRIREFLEDLPLNRPKEMMELRTEEHAQTKTAN